MKQFYFFVCLLSAQFAFAQSYDNSFNGNATIHENDTYGGIGMIEIPTDIIYDAVTGKIIMLNQFNGDGANIHRFNADGTNDETFGTDGKEEIDISAFDHFSNIFFDDDGYRLTGYKYIDPSQWVPFNEDLHADGSINTSFGTDGIIGEYSIDRAIIQTAYKTTSGKYFLAGALNSIGTYGAPIMSFNADGTYNTAFGLYSLELNELTNFYDMTELPDGRILATGETHDNFGEYFPIIACFLPEGGLDPSFGDAGVVMPEMPLANNIFVIDQVVADGDGNIYVSGMIRLEPSDDGFKIFVAKFDSYGNVMTDFGTDGYAFTVTTFFPEINALLLSPSNNIYGISTGHSETDATSITHIFKFLPDGTPDAAFTNGEPGLFQIQPAETSIYDDIAGQDMLMQTDGKLVVLGYTDGYSLNDDYWICRITTNESPLDIITENRQAPTILYPNPATDNITVQSNEIMQSIEVLSTSGQIVLSADANTASKTLQLQNLSAGIYILRIKSTNGSSAAQYFIKQ